jgi:hypothetical protein
MYKEEQEFEIGDMAYMFDEDNIPFESEVHTIILKDGKYYYKTDACDFEKVDIGDCVFLSEASRDVRLENMHYKH